MIEWGRWRWGFWFKVWGYGPYINLRSAGLPPSICWMTPRRVWPKQRLPKNVELEFAMFVEELKSKD